MVGPAAVEVVERDLSRDPRRRLVTDFVGDFGVPIGSLSQQFGRGVRAHPLRASRGQQPALAFDQNAVPPRVAVNLERDALRDALRVSDRLSGGWVGDATVPVGVAADVYLVRDQQPIFCADEENRATRI